ncbi:MAG: 3D domain-containing protein [Turicibacter sp.]|nr:3D domain-containing protein [Turicibacter sp.]
MSLGVIITSIFAIMHSNLNEVNMNEVTIVENGERNTFTTEAETVLSLVTGGYIQFGNFDEMNMEIHDEVYDGMEIEITRANQMIINDGGERFYVMTTETDVDEVLSEHNIELSDDDLLEVIRTVTTTEGEELHINPAGLTATAAENTIEIEVTRVTFDTVTDVIETTLETEYIYTDDLPDGERIVRVEGSPRVEETVIENKYHNGEFFMTVNEEVNLVDEGARRVVEIGTYVYVPEPTTPAPAAPSQSTSNSSSTPAATNVLDTFTASVTAYLATCSGCSGFTASGRDVRNNVHFEDSAFGTVRIVAACRQFPFGTIIYISGIGNAVVLDRGGAVSGNVLDLLMSSSENPIQFGRQSLQAQVLRLGW